MIHVATLDDLRRFMEPLRESSGMAFRTLAKETDMSPGTVLHIHHGRHWPRVDRLGALLQWYGETVTIGWDPNGKGGVGNDYKTGQ